MKMILVSMPSFIAGFAVGALSGIFIIALMEAGRDD